MFAGIWSFMTLIVAAGVGIVSFGFAREYVRQRLRFVDAARHPLAPWIAAGMVLLVATPIAWFLPLVTGFTALVAGAAAGFGTASGVKALKRGE